MGIRARIVCGVYVVVSTASCNHTDNSLQGSGVPGQACSDPGRLASCYSGPPATYNVGACSTGVTTCGWDLVWSECKNEHLPTEDGSDDCTNGIDDDCDGKVDEGYDADGDGWGTCEGDCCDTTECAADPTKVNPGAFEAAGNLLDDDCDGVIDNPDPGCVAGDPADVFAYARALDLCRKTTKDATGIDQRWGVISVKLTRADGTPLPTAAAPQSAIKGTFGVDTPRYGDSMVVLSTGPAVDSADPAWQPWQPGTMMQGPGGSAPSSWVSANGGVFPSAPGCPKPGGSDVFDPVMLTLEIRVPTNASSFNISSFFMSAEYPEWVCSTYNDFFVMLLDSTWKGAPANPKDGNLAFYTNTSGMTFPVGVNLAQGTSLFQQCVNGTLGCSGTNTSTTTSCVSQAELAGTGFDQPGVACDPNGIVGGGTGWLSTTGNVVAGEIITLRIAIWDTSDSAYDSLALVDNFQWKIDPTTPGTGTPLQ
jgi:hypothetical protein